ncbi:MAG TPA: beta-L-arabinofuranosidase domain-containing protein, partial [Verrucomicrobiae bacterium]
MKKTVALRIRFAIRNLVFLFALVMAGNISAHASVTVVDTPPARASIPLHPGNRAPLAPSPFVKLPIGSIRPQGWLRHQLELEREGMTGRLKEISPWLDFDKSSWTDKEGRGKFGWEEMPYWLKGYGDLGYVLGDERIIAEAKRWIEAAIASQREDGWFGPRDLLTSLNGKPDLWPHMVMLNVLQSYYEFSGDPRVIEVMTRYFKWENQLPVSAFGEGYWPKLRFGDNIESVFWLYNRTGEPWLLDLARKIHQGMARWDDDVINWHNVNIAQGFRAGTVFGMLSGNPSHLASAERNYAKVMGLYGQFPGGGFVGDENCRPGYTDPRGGFETCGWVEFMHSFQMLTKITGNPMWADRCEEIAFNSLPAAMTPDQKALHYITCANQVQLDQHNKSPGIENRGTMFSYSPFEVYRCCQHNVSHGWPYYAEELWLATPDNGLCASLYAASEVWAKVGSGVEVRIVEKTDYPFGETITFNVFPKKQSKFPLYLRIPRWCEKPELKVNGVREKLKAGPSSFIVIQRNWSAWDTVTLRLPMRVTVRTWAKQQNAVSVNYGPLSFALAIKERWTKYGDRNANWPEWEVFPETPWNYGLVLDSQNPASSFRVVRVGEDCEIAASMDLFIPGLFDPEATPIRLQAKACKIPAWQMDHLNMVGKLQPSPAKSDEPIET